MKIAIRFVSALAVSFQALFGLAYAEDQPAYAEQCQKSVEATAKHAFKWTGDKNGPIFTMEKWFDYDKSMITIKGDNFETLENIGIFQDAKGKVAYQHGEGVYKKTHFECDYDETSNKVLAVRVSIVDK